MPLCRSEHVKVRDYTYPTFRVFNRHNLHRVLKQEARSSKFPYFGGGPYIKIIFQLMIKIMIILSFPPPCFVSFRGLTQRCNMTTLKNSKLLSWLERWKSPSLQPEPGLNFPPAGDARARDNTAAAPTPADASFKDHLFCASFCPCRPLHRTEACFFRDAPLLASRGICNRPSQERMGCMNILASTFAMSASVFHRCLMLGE